MRPVSLAITCVVTGFAAGFLVASHGWIEFTRLLRSSSAAEYWYAQLALSNRLSGEGRHFEAAVHAMNAADADAGVGFEWLERSRTIGYWEWFEQPWNAGPDLFLGKIWELSSIDPGNGKKILEAEDRARSAVLFERTSCPDLALLQWQAAESLHSKWAKETEREQARRVMPDTSEFRRAMDDQMLAPTRAEANAARERANDLIWRAAEQGPGAKPIAEPQAGAERAARHQ